MRRWQHCTSTEQPKLGSLLSEYELYSPTNAHPIPSAEAALSFLWLLPCKAALSTCMHSCSPSESASLWGTVLDNAPCLTTFHETLFTHSVLSTSSFHTCHFPPDVAFPKNACLPFLAVFGVCICPQCPSLSP